MLYWRLARYKWVYILLIFLFVALSLKDVLTAYLAFNVHAPDLSTVDGEAIRHQILMGGLKTDNLIFEFGFYTVVYVPFIISFIGYDYLSLKNKFLKFSIGKNHSYQQLVTRLKGQLGLLASVIYLLSFWLVVALSLVTGQIDMGESLNHAFAETSILHHLIANDVMYLVFFSFLTAIGVFVNSIFYFKILDMVKNFIRGAGLYLAFMIPLSIILYRLLPHYLVPMTILSYKAYANWTLPTVLLTYLSYLIAYGVMYVYDKQEI